MSVLGRQIPEMDAAQVEIESGRMTRTEAAKKFNLSARWIMRKDWYKAYRAKQKAQSKVPTEKMPATFDNAGLSGHPMRVTWYQIMRRCYIPATKAYPDYGGRGIRVEERWHNLRNFVEDVGQKPSSSHSIDRIDNDGNYGPDNFRWATPAQQRANSRLAFQTTAREKLVREAMEKAGKPVSLSELEEIMGENWSKGAKVSSRLAVLRNALLRMNALQVSKGKWILPTDDRATTQTESDKP